MSFYLFDRLGPQRYQERWGLDFEEFQAGQRFRHRPGVTLTQQDNTDESLDSINAAMLHYDAHYAAQTTWKLPLMVSTLTIQRLIGMASRTFGRKRLIPTFSEILLPSPLFGGDTLYAESEIVGTGAGDTDCGLVNVTTRGLNQHGKEVAKLTYAIEVYRRGRHPLDQGGTHEAAAEPRFEMYRKEADGSLLERYGLFFEDAQDGDAFVHFPRRHFRREEAIEHSLRSMDSNPQFHDLGWVDAHQGGRYRIPEAWVITAATAASTRTFGRVVANLGWSDVQLPVSVYAGDSVLTESKVIEKRESKSRPNEGILTVDTWSRNQRNEIVLSYRRRLLVYKRDADTPYGKAGYA
jgi:itaconyl-CoA hydratase